MPIIRFGLAALLATIVVVWAIRCIDPDPVTTRAPEPASDLVAGEEAIARNPLLAEALDPATRLPLDRIEPAHVLPALSAAISMSRQRIDVIAQATGPATFANTVEALERAGRPVARVSALFHALNQLRGGPPWRQLEAPVADLLAEHAVFIRDRPELLARLDAVTANSQPPLAPEQQRLLDVTRQRLIDHGLGLDPNGRRVFSGNEKTLDELGRRFNRNLRRATGGYELLLDSRQRLAGLPAAAVVRARRDAGDRGHAQGWALTLGRHSLFDVLRFSPDRELRRTLYQAWRHHSGGRPYGQRGNNNDIMRRILALRAEQARLLGHAHHWQRVLSSSSAPSADHFDALFQTVLDKAQAAAQTEIEHIEEQLRAAGHSILPRPWDWWYYRERVHRNSRPDDPAPVREWFELETVRDSVFALAESLWGLTFVPDPALPIWHETVQGFVVSDRDGGRLGVVYLDLVQRTGKRGGAWMSSLRPASAVGGPVVAAVANFGDTPAAPAILLTPDQVETLYHELGHALHVLFAKVHHPSLTAVRVADDFVEVPALIMERFALHPPWLERRARHYRSGVPLRSDQIKALKARRARLGGIETLQLLAAIATDLAWHRAEPGSLDNPEKLAAAVRHRFDWPPIVTPHAVLGDYADLFAGRRGGRSHRRLWADVMAADAFAALTRGGTFDDRRAQALRRELLAPGNRRDPMASWHAFRGRLPDPVHWLNERGVEPLKSLNR